MLLLRNTKKLQSILQQNVTTRNNQPQQPFVDQKNAVVESIKDISMHSLTNEQERMLGTLEIEPHIGSNGIKQLEGVLFRNSLDIATAAAEVNRIVGQINNAISRSDQIQANLKPLLDPAVEDNDTDDLDDVIMRIHFQNDVALENITDFKKWGITWWEIGRGIAMAHNHAPEDIKIIGAQKGSIIIELAVIATIATTTSTIILAALEVADRVLTIQKKAEEIKMLKLGNKKLEAELLKEAETAKKTGLENITKEITVNLNINENGDGEKVKVLEKAVKNLIEFVEKGGEVDFFTPDQDEETQDVEQLKINFAEIKKLEKRVLAIEKNDEN